MPWSRSHHSRGRKHNALLSVCLKFFTLPSFVFVQAFAHRWKFVTAGGFDVHLSFLCGIHERFASRGNAEWCKDEDYLLQPEF